MKAVLDVGQFVSATRQAHGHPAQILAAWRAGQFELVTSSGILDDLRRVLRYPRLRKRHGWSDEEIELFVESIALAATATPGDLEVNAVIEDPTDNKVLAAAVEGQADYVVASDDSFDQAWKLCPDSHRPLAALPGSAARRSARGR
jgi:putative PIN family toxin of toxin-antitoxin system